MLSCSSTDMVGRHYLLKAQKQYVERTGLGRAGDLPQPQSTLLQHRQKHYE